ncbi:MAG: mechanosensitive ion channel family protein [Methylococcales bacterium]|nr:mechanosensitive ion channel family protein [Methylococcales bacterium]
MTKPLIFLIMLILSVTVNAKPSDQDDVINKLSKLNSFNQSLLTLEDDEKIDRLLTEKNQLLSDLMFQLRSTLVEKLPGVIDKKRLNFLKTRISVNQEKNNTLAVQRDKLKQALYHVQQNTHESILYFIQAAHNYEQPETIVLYAKQALSDNTKERKLIELPDETESSIYHDVVKNYKQFHIFNDTYRDILSYAANNPEQISVKHWIKNFTLPSMIAYVNHFEFIKPYNHKLSAFKVDVGGVFLSIMIVLVVYLFHPFVFRCTSWFVETYLLEAGADHQELIYHEIRRPLRTLLIFFGLDLANYAFFYKTDYRLLLENVIFVVYAFIYSWFFFKLLDSIALLHIRKICRTNKELRKELFNLGVQVSKGLILVLIITVCLKHFGINITAIVSTLGIGGLAFALAAKDTLSNLFGGVTILFDNIFRMGDWVKIGDAEGTVAEIGLRSTTIRTFDNALITIPNASVSVSCVKNWNRRVVGRRIKMYIGLTYESDMKDIRQALEDIRTMLQHHSDIANPHSTIQGRKRRNFRFSSQADTQGIKNMQLVFMDRYNDFSIDILVYCFSKTVNWSEWLAVKEDVLFKIADILQKNNLEFAYPTEVRINRDGENLKDKTKEESFES